MQVFDAACPKNPEMPAQNGPEKVAEDKGQVPDCHVSKASAT